MSTLNRRDSRSAAGLAGFAAMAGTTLAQTGSVQLGVVRPGPVDATSPVPGQAARNAIGSHDRLEESETCT